MGYTLRLILGVYLIVSICQQLECTETKHQIEQTTDSIKETISANETNNQTIHELSKPKTDQTISSNNISNNLIKIVNENNTNNNSNERVNLARAIDIKKYVSKEFHDRNNVYSLPSASPSSASQSDTEKFVNYDFQTTTYKLQDYRKDFDFNAQLTTPKSLIFDKNYKETVDSVDQTLEHIDSEEDSSSSESNEDESFDKLYEKSKKNPNNSSLDYKDFKKIIKNDTNDHKSEHHDLIVEEGKKLTYKSNYNQTKIIDDKPKENPDSGRFMKNYETTTWKNTILTKPPSVRNNSHISILSNRIETETLKAIDSNTATTESIAKINEPSVQENQVIPVRIEAPNNATTPEIVEIVTQLPTTPIDLIEETSTTTDSTTTEPATESVSTTETTETSTIIDETTTTEIITTIDPITSTTEIVTDSSTENLTTETNWRTPKQFDVDNQTTTETVINNNVTQISTETTTESVTEKLETTTIEMTRSETTETSTVNLITNEMETSTEFTEQVTTELPTTESDVVNKITKQDFSEKPVLNSTEITTARNTVNVIKANVKTVDITTESAAETTETQTVIRVPKFDENFSKTTETPETQTVISVPKFEDNFTKTTETQTVKNLPKFDDNFSKTSNSTTETVETITIIEFPTNRTNDYTTYAGDLSTSDSGEIIGNTDDSDTGKVVAIVISSIGAVCLILLAGLLFIMKKRQKRFNYGQRCRPVSLDDYSMDNVSVYNSVRRKAIDRSSKRSYRNPAFEDPVSVSHPLNFPALGKFANNFDDIKAEFEEIPQITAKTNELPDGCDTKNRYANVIPLPETRVFLSLRDGCPNSDYINANYVTGPKNVKGYYIACQAPMQNTVDDFWRMIWEQQCKVILMLTHLFENGVEKCFDYLPPSEVLDCHRLFGDYQVTLKKREVKEKYIISIVQLKNMVSNSWREVTHFWYLGWPDKGVPSEANSLIAFLIEARSYMKSSAIDRNELNGGLSNGNVVNDINPVVVHCSPGTGRTGVVIACDIAIREFEQNRLVDIPRILYRIRRDRASAVQTKEQYIFIYKVISLYATKLTGGALDSL